MDKTVRQHIQTLKTRLQEVSDRLMAEQDRDAANLLEVHIRSIKLAISHYEAAISIEKDLV